MITPAPATFWKFVKRNELFAFAEAYEAIVGVGLHTNESGLKKLVIYDAEKLRDVLGYTSLSAHVRMSATAIVSKATEGSSLVESSFVS